MSTALPWSINTTKIEQPEQKEFQPVPANTDFTMIISNTEGIETQSGGFQIKIETTIADEGKFKNAKLWTKLTLFSPGVDYAAAKALAKSAGFDALSGQQKSVVIGQEQFKSLCEACGIVGDVTDSSVLHKRLVVGRTRLQKGNNGYSDQTVVGSWKPVNKQPAQPQAAQSSGGFAWEQR